MGILRPLDEALLVQKALRARREPSVMNQTAAPQWRPEYEQEPPLENVSPEDFVPSPKSVAAALKAAGPLVGALGVIKPYKVLTKGPATHGTSYDVEDYAKLQDVLAPYAKPRMLDPERSNMLAQVLRTAQEPGAKTHVLMTPDNEPTAAFTRLPGDAMGLPQGTDYLAQLVALAGQKGTGRQALATNREVGPAEFIATPEAQGFYQKLLRERFPGLQMSQDPEFMSTRYLLKGTK